MGVVADDFVKTVQLCIHCSEPCPRAAKYCKNCLTVGQREAMDAENKQIFEAAGLPPYVPPQI